jgi:hypothetical protein
MLPVIRCGKIGQSVEIAMTDAPMKAPWHLWLIGVIAALFNSIGVFDFVMSLAQGAKYQASAGMTPGARNVAFVDTGWTPTCCR